MSRLPAVKTLYDILPKGTEGGKEFARIIDLLLFHEARRLGKKITIFNDSSGDYYGLDSFEGDSFRKDGTTGYQYKFYPSPLSKTHRSDIVDSLKRTAQKQEKLKLKKWILVTPQDLTQSSQRKDLGDVAWFENLRLELGLEFELEHFGHSKILPLFLETPTICLYYYPDLVPEGATRRRTIQDIRQRYDENLTSLSRYIKFVGMPVYKPEATRGVPMEDIYIPLSVTPDGSDPDELRIPRINPFALLKPGLRSIILGDPGSGKSTLLRFLSLTGISEPLQNRYQALSDDRLPILVILRRYADELKSRKNLSLLDYIKEIIKGDFNLSSADHSFFEYYLESGKAILLFDGLDELPNPSFKELVRDRIQSFTITYPGNTTIVTSRIVGYDHPFRFIEKDFNHYRVTRLDIEEIKQFVRDWYKVRIENEIEREANIRDLIRIIEDPGHVAIRELSENPLLLTIIALVHRIDAVLPDERVVLYQKCTETLLNTWHTAKYQDVEIRNKGKIERRNRRRMEVIANWMHCQSIGTDKTQRSIAKYTDLKDFLTKHIEDVEKLYDPDKEPEDLADEFLEFVKTKVGLLIEVGDAQYSFVHLTFQEYLTSENIRTTNEKIGVLGIWETIKDYSDSPYWHEVIRLMLGSLKSNDSQEAIIENIITQDIAYNRALLLGGLLLDGIESAEYHQQEILKRLLILACKTDDLVQLRPLIAILREWIAKDSAHKQSVALAFKSLWDEIENAPEKIALLLIIYALNSSEEEVEVLIGNSFLNTEKSTSLFRIFISGKIGEKIPRSLTRKIENFWQAKNYLSIDSPYGNLVAVAGHSVSAALDYYTFMKRSFEELMIVIGSGGYGPFRDFILNNLLISPVGQLFLNNIENWSLLEQKRQKEFPRDKQLRKVLEQLLDLKPGSRRSLIRNRNTVKFLDSNNLTMSPNRSKESALNKIRYQVKVNSLDENSKSFSKNFWEDFLATPTLYTPLLELLCDIFVEEVRAQWWEALRVNFLPKVPERINLVNQSEWKRVEQAFEEGKASDIEIYNAAWQLLFDVWLYVFEYYETPDKTLFHRIAELTRNSEAASLRIAHCVRDIAYGNESRAEDLLAMLRLDAPEYRSIFETCGWIKPNRTSGTKATEGQAVENLKKTRKTSKT